MQGQSSPLLDSAPAHQPADCGDELVSLRTAVGRRVASLPCCWLDARLSNGATDLAARDFYGTMTAFPQQDIPRFLTAAEVAERLGVTRAYVYEHAAELGVVRLGGGRRPRIRFDPRILDRALRGNESAQREEPRPERNEPRRRKSERRRRASYELLPVRGEELR